MARAPAAAADPDMADDMAAPADEAMTDQGEGAEAEPTSTVVVTICKDGDNSYTVYAGDEQEAGEDQAAPADGMENGTQVKGIGAALHEAMQILQADAEGGDGQGGAQAQFLEGAGEGPQA